MNSFFKMWSDILHVQGEKILAVRSAKDRFREKNILWALLAALTTPVSGLGLLFKTMPFSMVVEVFGNVWVLDELRDGRVWQNGGSRLGWCSPEVSKEH